MSLVNAVRWGILGPGSIANRLAEGVSAVPDAELVAVGSRDFSRAVAFADKYYIPHRHASYETLVEDPDVDVIYVATPHPFHKEHSLLALNAGKAVLCEKPFTINASELADVVQVARTQKLFLMEAMWTRFFPIMYKVRELLESGEIGDVRMIHADFGFRATYNPESRLFSPALGGGALLDVGVYTISFASMILGEPNRISGLATKAGTGVDDSAGIVLGHPGGQLAVLSTTVTANTPHEATIIGTEGRIRLAPSWWKPERLTLSRSGKTDHELELPSASTGFNYEVSEVGRCLREGLLESPVMPLDESLAIMRTMDNLRKQWGLKYPTE